ncbi:MAG: ferrochelatase [Phototrophicaceae bacterium]
MSVHGAPTKDYPKYDNEARQYDAILVMSFGGPDKADDVVPFLENVTRGRGIPRERLVEVGEHYYQFGGKSPINEQNIALIDALKEELAEHGHDLPVYFGNRNWHPMITDTLQQMKQDGVKRAIAFFTSGFSCYSGCRQYRENIIEAQAAVGDGAPEIDKIRVFYNHPGFIYPMVDNIKDALKTWSDDQQDKVHLIFTAHSIPMGQARNSAYETQLMESCRIIAEIIGTDNYKLVYQSRSGPPQMPWLEPDIVDYMEEIHANGVNDVIIAPIGFISDHMEVLFDLDTEARDAANELGMTMVRAGTVGTAKPFVAMIRELVEERMTANPERKALGKRDANHDVCPIDCCLPGTRPTRPAAPTTDSA